MCCTWIFKSSTCGHLLKKWRHLCQFRENCKGKSKKVIFKQICCSDECCRQQWKVAIDERGRSGEALEAHKNSVIGGARLCDINVALGTNFPGEVLPTPEVYRRKDELEAHYEQAKMQCEGHTKCNFERKTLDPEEFEDAELLSDAADSDDEDL